MVLIGMLIQEIGTKNSGYMLEDLNIKINIHIHRTLSAVDQVDQYFPLQREISLSV